MTIRTRTSPQWPTAPRSKPGVAAASEGPAQGRGRSGGGGAPGSMQFMGTGRALSGPAYQPDPTGSALANAGGQPGGSRGRPVPTIDHALTATVLREIFTVSALLAVFAVVWGVVA